MENDYVHFKEARAAAFQKRTRQRFPSRGAVFLTYSSQSIPSRLGMSETLHLLRANQLGQSHTIHGDPNQTKRVDPLLTVVSTHPRRNVSDIQTLNGVPRTHKIALMIFQRHGAC